MPATQYIGDWISRMSEKLGWFKFYPGDWARDLEEHPPEIEGYWIRICCKLSWEPDRGQAVKHLEQWARVMRVIDLEEARRVIVYLRDAGIADVSGDPYKAGEPIAIVSRRMVRDERERRGNAIRQERHRKKKAALTEDDAAPDAESNGLHNETHNGAHNGAANGGHGPYTLDARNATGNANDNGPPGLERNAGSSGGSGGGLTGQSEQSEQSREKPTVKRRRSVPKLAVALGDEAHGLHGLAVWFHEILWPAYPPRHGRKAGKAEAWEWLARENPDADGLNRIMAKLREDLAGGDWQRGIGIKDCVRWLRANDKNGWESTLAPSDTGEDPYEGLDD